MELERDLQQPEPKYAGFWIRFLAAIIDSIVLFIVMAMPFYFLFDNTALSFDLTASLAEQSATLTAIGRQALVKGGIYLVLYVFCWMKFLGTPGKLILKTQIVDANTFKALSLGQSLIRYLGYIVSTLVFCLGFIWVGIDAKKRGFHDMMAGSVVIYKQGDSQ